MLAAMIKLLLIIRIVTFEVKFACLILVKVS